MKTYLTKFRAYCNESKEIKTFAGKEIEANSIDEAKAYCKAFAPYLTVVGEKVCEFGDCNSNNRDISSRYIFLLPDLFPKNTKDFNDFLCEDFWSCTDKEESKDGRTPMCLNQQLELALKREDYKEAARLRDLINQNDNNQ